LRLNFANDKQHGLARTAGGDSSNPNPFARLLSYTKGVSMNRLLATFFLVLLILGLLFSMYSFAKGRFMEGLYIYPLLITIYVVMNLGGKGKK
jgi:hypothetical protein